MKKSEEKPFTAAQAAQKRNKADKNAMDKFTAAQAAQKSHYRP